MTVNQSTNISSNDSPRRKKKIKKNANNKSIQSTDPKNIKVQTRKRKASPTQDSSNSQNDNIKNKTAKLGDSETRPMKAKKNKKLISTPTSDGNQAKPSPTTPVTKDSSTTDASSNNSIIRPKKTKKKAKKNKKLGTPTSDGNQAKPSPTTPVTKDSSTTDASSNNSITRPKKTKKKAKKNKKLSTPTSDGNQAKSSPTAPVTKDSSTMDASSNNSVGLTTPKKNKKKGKKNKKKVSTPLSDKDHMIRCLEYLEKWKNDNSNWKFEKIVQTKLFASIFQKNKVPEESFKIFLEYMANSSPRSKKVLLEKATARVEAMEHWEKSSEDERSGKSAPEKFGYERARSVLQHLQ